MWLKCIHILRCPRTYLGASITSGLLIGTLFLWQSLIRHEDRKIESKAAAYGEGIGRQIRQELNDRVLTFTRLATHGTSHSLSSGLKQEVQSLILHLPGTLAIARLNAHHRLEWLYPERSDLSFRLKTSSSSQFLESARRSRHFVFTESFVLKSGEPGALLFIPIFRGNRYQGSLAVLTQYSAFFQQAADTPDGYSLEIREAKSVLFRKEEHLRAAAEFGQTVPFFYNTLGWKLSVTPHALTLKQERDTLPTIFLVCGILISALFGIIVWLLSLKWVRDREIASHQRFLQSIIDHLPVALFCKDAKRNLEYTIWNKMATRLWGFSQTDMLGKTDRDVFPSERATAFNRHDLQALASNDPIEIQEEVVPSQHLGSRLARTLKIRVADNSGQMRYVLGFSQDITEEKAAQEKLERAGQELERQVELRTDELRQMIEAVKERESYFRQLADSMPHNVWTAQPNGKIDYYNQRWYEFTGAVDGCDFNGEWNMILHEEDRTNVVSRFSQSLQEGIPFEAEYRLWDRQHGEYRWFLGRAIPARNSQGEIIKWFGTCTDIHDQRMATEKAHTAEQQLKTVLSNLPIILWATDKEGRYTLTEGQTLKNIGLTPSDKIGQSHFEFLKDDPQSCERTRLALAGQVVSGQAHLRGRWFDTRYSPIYAKDGSVTGMVGISIDITDKKKIEEEKSQVLVREKAALEASRIKSEFIANMSHEIRTPINGVIGMVDLLLSTQLSAEQKRYTESILSSAESLLTIVNDILDLSKIEAGKMEVERVPFNLQQVFQIVDRTFEHQAQGKGLIFKKSFAADLPAQFYGDPTRLRQVLFNLVSNAVKFTLQGEVHITVSPIRHDDDRWVLKFSIHDTGIGIAKQVQQHLFQPFCQADSSTTRRFGGTGLGLSISKRLIELMGGEIGLESQQGEGSTFWFTVPVEVRHETLQALPAVEHISFDKPLSILVAEDNVINQLVTVKMLEKYGHKVDVVANGIEALQALQTKYYDIVLMDCQMPELDGYETTRQVRANDDPSLRSIPIIAMTAHAMSGDREACLESGMDDYVAKPIRSEELARVIRDQVASHSRRVLTPQTPSELMN